MLCSFCWIYIWWGAYVMRSPSCRLNFIWIFCFWCTRWQGRHSLFKRGIIISMTVFKILTEVRISRSSSLFWKRRFFWEMSRWTQRVVTWIRLEIIMRRRSVVSTRYIVVSLDVIKEFLHSLSLHPIRHLNNIIKLSTRFYMIKGTNKIYIRMLLQISWDLIL